MLTREEAVAACRLELRRESEYAGVEVRIGGDGHESPNFFVFYPNAAAYLQSRLSRDSLAHRIPPIVVDRRTGEVRRPFAAGTRVQAHMLGAGEWFVSRAVPGVPVDAPPARIPDARLSARWSVEELRAMTRRLARFRIVPGGRDSGDALVAVLFATSPTAAEEGLSAMGLLGTGGSPGAMPDEGERMHIRRSSDTDLVELRIAGNTGDPWSFGEADLALAERTERMLDGAAWIRAWIEPAGGVTPESDPELF